MLMGGRMEAGKDTVGRMGLITGENMMVEGGAKSSSPPQRPQRERLGRVMFNKEHKRCILKLASKGLAWRESPWDTLT